MCIYFVANICVSRFGLGWAHDVFTIAYYMLMHTYSTLSIFLYIELYWDFSDCLFLPLSLSFVWVNLLLWHLNVNLLRPETLFVLGHPLLLILHLFLSGSVMRRPNRTSLRTSLDEVFILNAKSFCRTSSTLTYPLSFTIGVGSHCVTFRSFVHPCLYRSFTPTYMDLIFQYLFLLLSFEVCTLWSHRILYPMCSMSRG